MNIVCIEFLTFAVNSISSNKRPNKHNFEINQVENAYTWSHLFITFVFAVNSITSNKHIFETSQVDNTYTWSHLFITFAFAVNSISSNKQPNKHNFEISQVDNTYTWSHQFILITQQGFPNSGKG